MTKRANFAVSVLFILFLGAAFVWNLILPDKAFSESENRYLQTFPSFSVSSLLRGDFTQKAESWCADQFLLRDRWISLKARLELLQGKKENNGVFLCEGERLLEPFEMPAPAVTDRQSAAVEHLTQNLKVPVTLGIIPSAAELYREYLPEGVRNDSQRAAIDRICARTHTASADLLTTLKAHKEEYIYYRTDHHWTSLGAYYGYTALSETLGFTPASLSSFDIKTVSDAFCGTAYSSSGFFWVSPDSMQTFLDSPQELRVLRYDTDDPVSGVLYDETMLQTKDKYRFYLGGNTPLAVIETGNTDLPSLLIVRDSYTDCLVPFLLAHYSQIHLIDLRYYRESISEYVESNGIDSVLVLYSLENFCTDANLALLAG